MKGRLYLPLFILLVFFTKSFSQDKTVDLLIVGGGASGTTAGVQAARMGTEVLIIEETPWLGGMLTSAGVSAIDGNHNMPSGLWGEFRQKLYDHYGGAEAVETGWVSNTLFEPSVGNKVLKELADEENLEIWHETSFQKADRIGNFWNVTIKRGKKTRVVRTKLLLDATELGDVAAAVGVSYDLGMDSKFETNEEFAPEEANDIVQDMTYVVILQDYGKDADMTIPKPRNYNINEFLCACDVSDPAGDGTPENDCFQMMQYGRLPNDKYMINWPKCGNDIYLNIVEMTPAERKRELEKAKEHTLNFLYYLQKELGFKNLGIAKDEFPTKDGLPMIPYHRESRRIHGLVQFNVNHAAAPYKQEEPIYRTGIAVGDYPIDHHHLKNPEAPEIDFIRIKVPAYNVPLGALIPTDVDGLIVAEKSISVSNIVNGATRLQPVVLGLGQAAGALAAVAIKNEVDPRDVNIREVQQGLLASKAYIMPFFDVKPDHLYFQEIQRIGATGILKGSGVPYKWANQTWFYPEREISEFELLSGLKEYYPIIASEHGSGKALTLGFFGDLVKKIDPELDKNKIFQEVLSGEVEETLLDRGRTAYLLDKFLNPFKMKIDFKGNILRNTQ